MIFADKEIKEKASSGRALEPKEIIRMFELSKASLKDSIADGAAVGVTAVAHKALRDARQAKRLLTPPYGPGLGCVDVPLISSIGYWHRDSFRRPTDGFHLSLPPNASECLLEVMRTSQLPSPEEMRVLRAAAVPIVAQHVLDGRGFAVLRLPWDDSMYVDALATGTAVLAASVGSLLDQDYDGTTIVHVRDLGHRLEDGARYHETNASGTLHTDGPQLENPPNLLFMACFSRAQDGGDSLLASSVTLHHQLSQIRPDLLATLHGKFHFDRRGFCEIDGETTLQKPIFACSSQGITFRYLYEYILDGHAKANVPLSSQQRDAIGALQDLLSRDDLLLKIGLDPGEVLIVNNSRVCHGRTAFRDRVAPGSVRHLIRLWAVA
jgi:alpha-ketoglutarate-dependent taurine dioxygenase